MIDGHVHLRDGEKQSYKETIKHGLQVFHLAGGDGLAEQSNPNPALTSRKTIEARLKKGDNDTIELKQTYPGFAMFHGVYAGVTDDPEQIIEVVDVYNERRKTDRRVVAIKMFAGQSTGNMGLVDDDKSTGEYKQRTGYRTVAKKDYTGVLAVHCEKEYEFKPALWDPFNPFTHTLARPPKAEVESVKDQVKFAQEEGFKGTLHICHISVPEALEYIEAMRSKVDFSITCELTPHHALLYDEMMDAEDGLLLKMNPPLRPKEMQEYMFQAFLDERIDCYGSDHAPHDLKDKFEKHASGVPAIYYAPHFIRKLRENGMSQEAIDRVTHDNFLKIFGLEGLIPNTHRQPIYDLADTQHFDAFAKLETLK